MSFPKLLPLLCISFSIVNQAFMWSHVCSPPLSAAQQSDEIEHLVKQLGSDNFRERDSAEESLRRIGRAALPALRLAQNNADREIRRHAKMLLDQLDVGHWLATLRRSVGRPYDASAKRR